MISLARQLAMRREIEEEMGELAGEERAVEWPEAINCGLVVSAHHQKPVQRCVDCAVPLYGRGRRLYCPTHRAARYPGKEMRTRASYAKGLARQRAARRAARAGRTCLDCGGAIEEHLTANAIRCVTCAKTAARTRPRKPRTPEQLARHAERERLRAQAKRSTKCPDCGGARPKRKQRCGPCGEKRRRQRRAWIARGDRFREQQATQQRSAA